jgi:D-psicose/D-tagatose/L-ribulose 3-epimerase
MPPGAAYSDFWNAGLESIGECLEDLERTHLTFAIEPRPHTMFTTVDSVLRFVDRFDAGASPKVVLDTSHLQAQQEMIDVAIEKAAPVLAGVHLSDHSAANNREPLGAGSVNWDAVFGALKRIDYGGPLDLELYGNGIKDIDKDYLAGKAFVESMIR